MYLQRENTNVQRVDVKNVKVVKDEYGQTAFQMSYLQ